MVNKAAADTRFYDDMHGKCGRMGLGSFELRRCRNKAWSYYVGVSRFHGWKTYENWQQYYML